MKKLFLTVGLLSTSLIFPIAAISCNNDTRGDSTIDESKTVIKPVDWSKFEGKYYDGTIVRWADGDTFRFVVTSETDNSMVLRNGKEYSVRISSIDTPEKNVQGTQSGEIEFRFANMSSDFGLSQIPVGNAVRIVTDGSRSFERIVGEVFYDKDGSTGFAYNYSNEIVKAGLTFPNASGILTNSQFNPNSIEYYTYIPMGYSFIYAQQQRKGFFNEVSGNTIEERYNAVRNIYKLRGEPNPGYFLATTRNNVFEFEQELKWTNKKDT
ncbi:hypothetical protein EI74_0519 [Mycoplasma testudineum]|uniref:TNase-like domain-containing protein n=1 Tax=Mycoplasma testudineum TaxID=244584 RepID=A0A4R6ICA7_9MOLU|nr:hypothetical protein [Mycoplasma testudineum]OYD26744.1 hypothetical protein CG473_02200 [Mycoplasma testudineum]TDO19880.1 hypothetical protein EI74_0519 [Mycoplasma testudineum]